MGFCCAPHRALCHTYIIIIANYQSPEDLYEFKLMYVVPPWTTLDKFVMQMRRKSTKFWVFNTIQSIKVGNNLRHWTCRIYVCMTLCTYERNYKKAKVYCSQKDFLKFEFISKKAMSSVCNLINCIMLGIVWFYFLACVQSTLSELEHRVMSLHII